MNGATFMLYTMEEGGRIHVCKVSEAEYHGTKEAREIRVSSPFSGRDLIIEPAFVALVRVEDNYDFVLGGAR